jgi:hypothetical protein
MGAEAPPELVRLLSAKSYAVKILMRAGGPAFAYIRLPASGSSVGARFPHHPYIRGVST